MRYWRFQDRRGFIGKGAKQYLQQQGSVALCAKNAGYEQ